MPRTATSALASKAIGDELRSARHRVGLTQREVADRIGTTAPYLSAVENGRENLTIGQIWAIAEALDVEVHFELRVPPPLELPDIPVPQRRVR